MKFKPLLLILFFSLFFSFASGFDSVWNFKIPDLSIYGLLSENNYWNGTNIFTFPTFFNDVSVNGNLVVDGNFSLTTPVETDLNFPINTLKVGSTNPPYSNTYTLDFSPTVVEQAFTTYQLTHTRAYNTSLEPHFHWRSEDNTLGDVVWCIEYRGASVYQNFTEWFTECVVSSSVGNTETHIMSPMLEIEDGIFGNSAIGEVRLFRNATDPRDTYSGDAMLMHFDIHYYVDKLGFNV